MGKDLRPDKVLRFFAKALEFHASTLVQDKKKLQESDNKFDINSKSKGKVGKESLKDVNIRKLTKGGKENKEKEEKIVTEKQEKEKEREKGEKEKEKADDKAVVSEMDGGTGNS